MLGIIYQFSQIKFQFCYSLIEIHKYLKSNSLTYAIHPLHAHILQTNELWQLNKMWFLNSFIRKVTLVQ